MNKKNGFTMVEVLGVVILIAAIALLVFPSMIEQFRKAKEDINSSTLQLIYSGADEYVNDNLNNFPKKTGNVYCITLRTLVDNGNLSDSITDVINDRDYDLDNNVVKVSFQSNNYQYRLVKANDCVEIES